jgi:hypothetical protein
MTSKRARATRSTSDSVRLRPTPSDSVRPRFRRLLLAPSPVRRSFVVRPLVVVRTRNSRRAPPRTQTTKQEEGGEAAHTRAAAAAAAGSPPAPRGRLARTHRARLTVPRCRRTA